MNQIYEEEKFLVQFEVDEAGEYYSELIFDDWETFVEYLKRNEFCDGTIDIRTIVSVKNEKVSVTSDSSGSITISGDLYYNTTSPDIKLDVDCNKMDERHGEI